MKEFYNEFIWFPLFVIDRPLDISRPKFFLPTGKSKNYQVSRKLKKAHNEASKNTLSIRKHHFRLHTLLHN